MTLPGPRVEPAAVVANKYGTKRVVPYAALSKRGGTVLASVKFCLHGKPLNHPDADYPCHTCVFEVSKLA